MEYKWRYVKNLTVKESERIKEIGPTKAYFYVFVWPRFKEFDETRIITLEHNGDLIGYAMYVPKSDIKKNGKYLPWGWKTPCAIVDRADGLVGVVVNKVHRRKKFGREIMNQLAWRLRRYTMCETVSYDALSANWIGRIFKENNFKTSRIPWTRN